MNRHSLPAALACMVLSLAPAGLHAEQPGRHPAYLHALADLRRRAHLERRGGDAMVKYEQTAIRRSTRPSAR